MTIFHRRSAGESSSEAVFRIRSDKPLYAGNLYLSANTYTVSDNYLFAHVATVTFYCSNESQHLQWPYDVNFVPHLGNSTTSGTAVNRYQPTDTNSVQIHTPHDTYTWYMDLLKVPYPRILNAYKLDSIKISTEYLFSNLGGGSFIYGGLRIHALTIEARKE